MQALIQQLRLEKATLTFEGKEILQNCSFLFPMNQNCRFVFANDQQKYFFFHSISQVAGFSQGQYFINDDNVLDFTFEEFLRYRIRIGFGFATRGLIHNRTLKDNILLPLRYHNIMPSKMSVEWFKHCTSFFDFGDELNRRPAEVSPSAQKATLILRTFILKPELVFLDTPEMLLSRKLQANLLQLIDEHRREHRLKHLYFATFDENLADCLADQSVILRNKKLELVKIQNLKKVGL